MDADLYVTLLSFPEEAAQAAQKGNLGEVGLH